MGKRSTIITACVITFAAVLFAAGTAQAKSIVYSGSGDDVIKIAKPSGKQTQQAVASFTHSGESNFIVWALNKKLKQTDLLVNTIGAYAGTVPLDLAHGSATYRLEIKADGDWTVTIKPLSSVRRFTGKVAGSGDDVLSYRGGARVATITHDGESNFVVWAYYAKSTALLVNEIGPYRGKSALSGNAILEIGADGAWSVVTKK